MSELTLNPEAAVRDGDKLIRVPALADAAAFADAPRKGQSTRGLRRRFTATRLAAPADDGLRLFRVY